MVGMGIRLRWAESQEFNCGHRPIVAGSSFWLGGGIFMFLSKLCYEEKIGPVENPLDIRMYGTVNDTIVDGPGLRFGVFVQGCSHHCPGCHNPKSQVAQGGTLRTVEDVYNEIKANPLVKSVTLSGGEPFEQPEACAQLARALKEDGYNVWAFSGYLYEDLLAMSQEREAITELLGNIDVLVDGPFVESLHSYELKWRGSANQRLIDMAATRSKGAVVLWEQPTFTFEKPANW